jgi:hypothetical protein
MTEHETQVVKRVLTHASTEIRAAQRCVEVLANLFEDMRHELYPRQASRIWYVLNQIPNLERVPYYAQSKPESFSQANQRYRWHFMEHAFHSYDMHNLANDMEELSEILSGVKIENVAESKVAFADDPRVHAGFETVRWIDQKEADKLRAQYGMEKE